MNISLPGNAMLIIGTCVFLAIALLLSGLYVMWFAYKGPLARKVEQRIRALSSASDDTQQAQLLKERLLSEVPRLERILLSIPRTHHLDRLIVQSGLNWTVSILLLSCGLLGMASCMVIVVFGRESILFGCASGAIVACLPLLYVSLRRAQRMKHIESQLPDALDFLTRALRAGHAFSSALQMIGNELPDPVAGEFRTVHDEVNFGVSLPQALSNLLERVPVTDLRYFTVAVMIQRESGGNLSEVLSKLSKLMRERAKLTAKVRVLSSEGRLSAWVLGLMPFLLAALMNFTNPDFMSLLWTDPMGISIIKCMFVLMAFGALILIKISKIRV